VGDTVCSVGVNVNIADGSTGARGTNEHGRWPSFLKGANQHKPESRALVEAEFSS
jgi:hypothetical protein